MFPFLPSHSCQSPEQLLAKSSPYQLQQGLLAFVNRHQNQQQPDSSSSASLLDNHFHIRIDTAEGRGADEDSSAKVNGLLVYL
jgi:hypothetical protein